MVIHRPGESQVDVGLRALALAVSGLGAALLLSSCATLWDFEDATSASKDVRDGAAGLRDDDGDAPDVADATAPTDASGPAEASVDARVADTGPAPVVDAARDAVLDTFVKDQQTADQGTPTAGTCVPSCSASAFCAKTPTMTSACVDPNDTCTDSASCTSGCCVWLEETSTTGRCAANATGFPIGYSCLCTMKETGNSDCKQCKAPEGSSSDVKVCSAGGL